MPEKAERKLRAEGLQKGFTGERLDKYVFGALRKMGWKPRKER